MSAEQRSSRGQLGFEVLSVEGHGDEATQAARGERVLGDDAALDVQCAVDVIGANRGGCCELDGATVLDVEARDDQMRLEVILSFQRSAERRVHNAFDLRDDLVACHLQFPTPQEVLQLDLVQVVVTPQERHYRLAVGKQDEGLHHGRGVNAEERGDLLDGPLVGG